MRIVFFLILQGCNAGSWLMGIKSGTELLRDAIVECEDLDLDAYDQGKKEALDRDPELAQSKERWKPDTSDHEVLSYAEWIKACDAISAGMPHEKREHQRAAERAPAKKSGGLNKTACTFNGKRLYGKVKEVTSFPDVKVRVVRSGGSNVLKVKKGSFASSCGKWEMVSSFPDLKVQFVSSFADFEITYSDFPGF